MPSILQVLTKQEPRDASDDVVEVGSLDSGVETTPSRQVRRNLMGSFGESARKESTSKLDIEDSTEKPDKSNESQQNEDVSTTEKPKQSNDKDRDVHAVSTARKRKGEQSEETYCVCKSIEGDGKMIAGRAQVSQLW